MADEFEQPPPAYSETEEPNSSFTPSMSDSKQVESETKQISDLSLAERKLTRTTSSGHLQKPIAIPATSPHAGSPFLRAYPPSLEAYGIPKETFIKFLDDLNRVAVKNPPLQVLKLAGLIVSFVPEQTAQIVGGSVNAAASIGTTVISKGRTEIALRKANRKLFMLQGLKCEIAKISAVAKIAGIPILNDNGKIDKDTALLGPIEDLKEFKDVPSHQRRLNALEPYIAHLDVQDLPEIDVPGNPLSKWSAHASEKERQKDEDKMIKARNKANERFHKKHDRLERREEKLERKLEKLQSTDSDEDDSKKQEKRLRKAERKCEKFEKKYDDRIEKIESRRQKRDKEEKGMKKILWLIIRNLDADSGVKDGDKNPYVPELSSRETEDES